MQLDAEAHETAVNPEACAPAGFGVAWILHRVPFHRSARVFCAPDLLVVTPTASQADADAQVTQFSSAPGREGIFCSRQVRPFHRCARVSETPRLLLVLPTATQADGAVQATPKRLLAPAPGGPGAAWTFQVEPFHRSASAAGAWFSPGRMENPTATQPVAEVQATPISWLIAPPGKRGVGWIAHVLPSHRSATGWNAPEELKEVPAAVQADADAQATVFRKVNCAPAGLGVRWMAQLLPFHRSARLPALEFPTAVHADGEVQATEPRAPPPCGGLAVA